MKVAVITDSLDTERVNSVNRYLKNILRHLLNISQSKSIFYLVHGKRNPRENLYKQARDLVMCPSPRKLEYKLRYARVVLRHTLCRKKFLPLMTLLPLALRKYHFDIIHYPNLEFGIPYLFFPFSSAKTVITFHGAGGLAIPPELHLGEEKESAAMVVATWRAFKQKLDAIITVSRSEKRVITKYLHFPEQKVRVVYHGVEDKFKPLRRLDATKEKIEKKYGISPPYILHLSSCVRKKNVLAIMKAFYKVFKLGVKCKLVVVGPKFRIKRVLGKLETLRDFYLRNTIFLNYVSDEDLPGIYNLADLFVFPSLHESFGMPIVEAMACGCPVITSNVYSCPEVAGDAAVLVNPYDLDELSTKMYKILTDEELKRNLRRKGLRRARTFSWKKCAMEHMKVYEEVYNE